MSDHQAGIMQETIECRRPAISKQLIYGSSRFGLWDRLRQEISHPETGPAPPDDSPPIDDPGIDPGNDEPVALSFEHVSDFKSYELTNHLGNVLTTVSDRRLATELGGHTADIISTQDYYLFGSLMPGRNWNSGGYRYGFQSQEAENDLYGLGNASFFKHRISDNRIGRFFAIDTLFSEYPFYSPYVFSGNRVIDMIEQDGLQPVLPQSKIDFYSSLPELKTSDWKEIGEGLQNIGDVTTGAGILGSGTGVGASLVPYGRFLSGVGLSIETAANVSLGKYEDIAYDAGSYVLGKTFTKGLIKGTKIDTKDITKEAKGIIEFGVEKALVLPIKLFTIEQIGSGKQNTTNSSNTETNDYTFPSLKYNHQTSTQDHTEVEIPLVIDGKID